MVKNMTIRVGALTFALSISFVAQAIADNGNSSTSGDSLDEVIVTASKRAEPLREVADSVTAFTGAALDALGAQSFQDYIGSAPGVQFQAAVPGVSNVTIRGIGTATVNPDQGQSTTGIYLNDVPLTDPGFAVSIPDVDVFDLQRVEVLRGPQGALFGTASLGGAVNYIINPVSLTDYEAHVQTGVSRTQNNSSDYGYTAKVAVNIPLINDVFGVRVTAIDRYDPGYLDNIGIHRDDTNDQQVHDYRLNALWKITDGTNLSFFTFYDRSHIGDQFSAFPSLGELVSNTLYPDSATFITRINSLKFNSDLDFATLTVSGADSRKFQDGQADFTPLFGGVIPTLVLTEAETHANSAEVRLASPSNQQIEWLGGVYFGHFNEGYTNPFLQKGAEFFYYNVNYTSNELSEFGEATYHFTDQWRVTVGGRNYDIRVATDTLQGAPAALAANGGAQRGVGFSPKGSLTFEPNKNFLVYGLVSKGFRQGGVNLVAPLAGFPTPTTYRSDSLVNYEVGIRPAWFDHRLTLDTTIFYIDWTDIQLRLARPDGFDYVDNAGGAHSKGVENSLEWRPTSNLALQASLTYLQAQLSQSLALGGGSVLDKGAVLPGASKWTSSETATYTWQTAAAPFIGVTHRFVSSATSNFDDNLPIGNYQDFDIRAGATWHSVTGTFYVNNVADRRGVTAATTFGTYVNDYYIRPRTIGLQFDWHL